MTKGFTSRFRFFYPSCRTRCPPPVASRDPLGCDAQQVREEHDLIHDREAEEAGPIPAAARSQDLPCRDPDLPGAVKPPDEFDVLQDWDFRKASRLFEVPAIQEQGLVAIGEPEPAAAQVDRFFDQPEKDPAVFDTQAEGAGDCARKIQQPDDLAAEPLRESCVGVEKEQDRGRRRLHSPVHLRGPTSWGVQDAGPCSHGCRGSSVGAASIDHDDLPQMGITAGSQRRGQVMRLVQGRNDDGDAAVRHV